MTSFPHSLSERTLAWKTGSFPFHCCLQCLVQASSHLSSSCRHTEGHVCVEWWGGHVFQASRAPQTMLQEDTLSVSKLDEASKVPETWTWKKTPTAHSLAPLSLGVQGRRISTPCPWPSAGPAAVLRPSRSRLLVPSAVLVENHKVALQIQVKPQTFLLQVRLRRSTPGSQENICPHLLILQMVTLRLRDEV